MATGRGAPRRPGGGVIAGVLIIAALLGATVGGGLALFQRGQADRASGPTSPTSAVRSSTSSHGRSPSATPRSSPSASPHPSASPSPSASPGDEAAAEAELNTLAAADLHDVSLDGRPVAQVSSKWVGISDSYQTSAHHGHTFSASDILIEHQQLRARFGDRHRVILLRGQDWGRGLRHQPGNETIWYTFVLGDFGSLTDAGAFCRQEFTPTSSAPLSDFCLPVSLRARH